MATTIRQQLVTAVINRLKLIKTTNTYTLDYGETFQNYETNIGDSVDEWRAVDIDPKELPMLVVRDLDTENDVSSDFTEKQINWLLIVVEIVTSGNTAAVELRKMLGDVNAAIRQDTTWGELAITTNPQKERFLIEQQSKRIAGGLIEFKVKYVSGRFNQYVTD